MLFHSGKCYGLLYPKTQSFNPALIKIKGCLLSLSLIGNSSVNLHNRMAQYCLGFVSGIRLEFLCFLTEQ